jgi:hypothetical protein
VNASRADAAPCARARHDRVDECCFECGNANALSRPPCAVYLAGKRALCPHRLHQRHDAHDLHGAFKVVGQHMEAHSVFTRGSRLVRKCVEPIQALRVPKGCSTVCRRNFIASGWRCRRLPVRGVELGQVAADAFLQLLDALLELGVSRPSGRALVQANQPHPSCAPARLAAACATANARFVAVVLLVRAVEGLQERFLLMVVVLSVWAFGRSLMLW